MMEDAFLEEKRPLGSLRKGVLGMGFVLILAALLYRLLVPFRPSLYQAGCISNLKQLSTIQVLYSSDFDDALPPFYSFDGANAGAALVRATKAYAKNSLIFACPFSPQAKKKTMEADPELGYDHFVLILREQNSSGVIKTSDIWNPAEKAWMHDPISKWELMPDGERVENFHAPYLNELTTSFFDTHVKRISLKLMNSRGQFLR